jgi:hypothetical protein
MGMKNNNPKTAANKFTKAVSGLEMVVPRILMNAANRVVAQISS